MVFDHNIPNAASLSSEEDAYVRASLAKLGSPSESQSGNDLSGRMKVYDPIKVYIQDRITLRHQKGIGFNNWRCVLYRPRCSESAIFDNMDKL